jgi:hypothetical protein
VQFFGRVDGHDAPPTVRYDNSPGPHNTLAESAPTRPVVRRSSLPSSIFDAQQRG